MAAMLWSEVGCRPSVRIISVEINECLYLFSKHAYLLLRTIVLVGVATSADSKNVLVVYSFFDGYTLFPPSPDALF